MSLGGVAQRIQDHAWLNTRKTLNRIDLQDPVHVFREVEHDRGVAALTRKAGSCASRQNRSTVPPADGYCGDDVGGVARNHESNRYLAVIRTVGRIQRTAAAIETDFTTNLTPQRVREIGCLRK